MDRKYNLKLDLQFRCNNQTMKFNQFDNNTSDFFMRITNAGKLVDVEKAIVVLAAIKPSGKVSSQFVDVENGLVYADLKNSMKDEIGTYTAQAMLILEDERVVTDPINYEVEEDKIFALLNDTVEATEDFTLLTDMLSRLSTIEISEEQRMINEAERILSEENRKIEEAKRVEAELIRVHEEAGRAKYDATRESNENIRKQNESIRLANETNRIDEEAKRVEEENKRKLAEEERNANYNFMTEDEERRRSEANAHKEAEVLRVQAETNRVNEEAKRRATEQGRVSAENTRVSNENVRKANELSRQNNETKRVEAETQRQNRYNSFIADAEANANNFENYTNTAKVKEEERKSNELDRKSQETKRVSNEVERISNENTRKANEEAREKNEISRQGIFEDKVDEFNEKIVELNTTKENFVSSVNAKVDNKISEIEVAKSDMTTTVSNKVNEVEGRFNALTASQQQSSEVIDARDGETSLKARLDRDIEKAKQVYVNVEGSHISTDSSSGYLKDVEILGNTIQSASNLADIRSVGDKVEGQELYEIPVLSVGKNLFKRLEHNYYGGITIEKDDGNEVLYKTTNWNTGVKLLINSRCLKLNTQYTLSWKNVAGGSALEGIYFSDNNFSSPELITRDRTFTITSYKNDFITVFMKNGSITSTSGFRNIQIEEGTVATPYEPYVEDKLTILSPVQLEKVGDVADRIVCKDGVWGVEKNVETETFNNIDNVYIEMYADGEKYLQFNMSFNKHLLNSYKGICDKFINVEFTNENDFECFSMHSAQLIIFKIRKDTLSTPNMDGFRKWCKANPITIKYTTINPTFIPLPHDQQVKLRTFANKTNISFLTEIEGSIKAQVPKSIGATVNTHTEQINNLNKELDRVKKLEESTVSTVTTESDFTTVEATSNGYFEDVKLEGKTLVNLFDKNKPWTQGKHNGIEGASIYKQYEVNKSSNNTYHIIAPIGDKSSNFTDARLMIYAYNKVTNRMSKLIADKTSNSHESINTVLTLTNDEVLLFNCWDISEDKFNKNYPTMMILEGDHTQNPPSYFEGLKSVGDGVDEIVVSSVNENLFSGEYKHGFYIDANTGLEGGTNSARSYIEEYISVTPNSTIYFNGCERTGVYGYDSSKKFTGALPTTQSITIPANVKYIRFTINNNSSYELTSVSYLTNKPYTPHQSDKKRLLYYNNETQTWEKPVLREWDSIEKHSDGKYYYHQRSGEVVFDGSENWSIATSLEKTDTIFVHTYDSNSPQNKHLLCDRFLYNKALDVYDIEGIRINGGFQIRISKSKLSTQDAQGFKQWLQTNNVTVVYQLAQEKVYECTNIDLITYEGETNYVVESGAIVPRTTLKVHNNISNVVSLLQKKVSLLESNVKASQEVQDMMILETDMRMLDIELALMDFIPMKLNLGGSDMLRSATYFNFLKNHIINETYEKEYLENVMNKYLATGRINQDEYNELYKMLYPPVYDIELPIEY